jgi:hypothetical protein
VKIQTKYEYWMRNKPPSTLKKQLARITAKLLAGKYKDAHSQNQARERAEAIAEKLRNYDSKPPT